MLLLIGLGVDEDTNDEDEVVVSDLGGTVLRDNMAWGSSNSGSRSKEKYFNEFYKAKEGHALHDYFCCKIIN